MRDENTVVFLHEKLDVWNRAIDYGLSIYAATQAFPGEEKFGRTSQLRRAAVSVSSNIAEGNARSGIRDKIRFFEISYGSLMETVSQLAISHRLGLIPNDQIGPLRSEAASVARMLSALRGSFERKLGV